MKWIRHISLAATVMLVACQSAGNKETISMLRNQRIEVNEVKIEGGLEKAMLSYQRFLKETPNDKLAPEALRRLADLKIEREYGTITESGEPASLPSVGGLSTSKPAERSESGGPAMASETPIGSLGPDPIVKEKEADSEQHVEQKQPSTVPTEGADTFSEPVNDLEKVGPVEAIALYQKLLNEYPLYGRNDQVLYQMSRAYEELGRTEEAMAVMQRMVLEFPKSRYIDEVQFRRAERFFMRKRYIDAEDAYMTIVNIGIGSFYYEIALYKLGWTFYKQELYEDALHKFITLLDYKVSMGYDFEQIEDETERKRTEDTFRVISLSFSNSGGADSVVEYFSRHGKRSYEDRVYSNLAEFYFDKRRYADASGTYSAFVNRNPFHEKAPNFHMRIIEIHTAGGFPSLILDAKKAFASTYGLEADYWNYFEPDARPDVLDYLKTNLIDLANHYHAKYQKPLKAEEKQIHYKEALRWYRGFLASFPMESESPVINYQLADLFLENRDFGKSAVEYEKTAYDYPLHEKAAEAGYAAVYVLREHLANTALEEKNSVKLEVIRSSLKFADTFPSHEKAAIVIGAAADDLYAMESYEEALTAARKLIEVFPDTDTEVVRGGWLVVGHSSYELQRYSEAEAAYLQVLSLLPGEDKTREDLVDNLAASIYKQGEQANEEQDFQTAADHFLRVGRVAPNSKVRANAEYDGAMALIQLKDWKSSASVLEGFRNSFPEHALQSEVTKKIAYVYREDGQLSKAASEYERIERESEDNEIRREALLVAAELYAEDGNPIRALEVYRRYADNFPQPMEVNLETRNKIASILKNQDQREDYLEELRKIVAIDASSGTNRTPRTRYLAAKAALVLAESVYDQFVGVRLVKPFENNLRKKRELMKAATKAFGDLMDYELGEVTAAATFYLAETYAHFSNALMTSERPKLTFDYHMVKSGETLSAIAKRYRIDVGRIVRENNINKSNLIVAGKKLKIPRGLYPEELEQYELAIEEQAYPFEEKGIEMHESNLELISRGVYNEWIDKSLQKLAELVPVRYAKKEETSGIISSMETYTFEIQGQVPTASEGVGSVAEAESVEAESVDEPEPLSKVESVEAEPVDEAEPLSKVESVETEPVNDPGAVAASAVTETLRVKALESSTVGDVVR